MTCMEMSGNGAVIGMVLIRPDQFQTPLARCRGPTDAIAVVVGTTRRGTAVPPFAATTARRFPTPTSGSGWPLSQVHNSYLTALCSANSKRPSWNRAVKAVGGH